MRVPCSVSGTSLRWMRRARPSAMAVLPTPASPISTALFLRRRARISTVCSISSSRPMTGSMRPAAASAVRSRPNSSSAGLALRRAGARDLGPRTFRTAAPCAARRPRRTPSAPCPAAGRRPAQSVGWCRKSQSRSLRLARWLHTQCDGAHGRFPARDLPADRARGPRAAPPTWSATSDAGVAAVVDPRLDIGEYLRLARYLGVSIEHILETHNHADHVSGHGRLAAATGARIHVHALAERGVRARAVRGRLGAGAGRRASCARCTRPGTGPSTRRSRCRHRARAGAVGGADRRLAVRGRHRAARPGGREGGGRARHLPLAARPLLELGDDVEVWPGHLGGSLCGGPAMDLKVSTTIGYERRHNALLGVADEDEFVARATAGLRPAAAELQGDRGDQPRPARSAGRSTRAADAAPGPAARRAGDRRPHRAAVRRRAHPGRDLQHDPAVGLRHAAGLDRRPRRGGRARRPRRRRRAARRRAGRGGRRGPDRGLPRGRDDELARGAAAGGVDRPAHRRRAARARATTLQILDVRERDEWEAGHIPGSRLRALPRHPRAARTAWTRRGRSP